jgi:hypothetical protein
MDYRIIGEEEEEMNWKKNHKKTRTVRGAENRERKQDKEIWWKESDRNEKEKHNIKMDKHISKEYTKPRDNKKIIRVPLSPEYQGTFLLP